MDKSFAFQFEVAKAVATDEYVIRGIASSPSVDRDDEQMSEAAIKKMLEQINSSKLPLHNEHGRSWDDRIGVVTKGEMTTDGKLMIEAKLNKKHPIAQYLYDKIKSGEQFGLSVAGKVKGFSQQLRNDLGKMVRIFDDIHLNEISVTARPANWDAMGLTAKSWAYEFAKSAPTLEGDHMEDETKPVEVTEPVADAEAAKEDAAPAPVTEETEAPAEAAEDTEVAKGRLTASKKESLLKSFDAKMAAYRAELLAELGLEKSAEPVKADLTEEVIVKALKRVLKVDEEPTGVSAIAKAFDEAVKAENSVLREQMEGMAEEIKKSNERVDQLMKLPLQRKGIAAAPEAGTEAIITLKSETDAEKPTAAASFADSYKQNRINQ